LESSGRIIGYYDLIVAATALERGSKVATFNRRHFATVKGLTVLEPKYPAHRLMRFSQILPTGEQRC
jgi:predicted nucleic acid-binding protein